MRKAERDAMNLRAEALFASGLDAALIAKRFGVKTESVSRHLMKRFGTSEPAKPYCAGVTTEPSVLSHLGGRVLPHWIEHHNGSNAA